MLMKKWYTLVISGGWSRWAYALGVLKWLENIGISEKIENIYWVSIGWLIAAYRWAWYRAEKIFELFTNFKISSSLTLSRWSMLSHDKLRKKIKSELPERFEKLKKKVYLWCTDVRNCKYVLFNRWDLIEPLLGTISIPWLFLPVRYWDYILADGWLINDFPVELARDKTSQNRIIGIFLNYFDWNQDIKTFFDWLSLSLEIMLKHNPLKKLKDVDHLFYKKLWIGLLETNKKKMKNLFEMWYKDCIEHFSK